MLTPNDSLTMPNELKAYTLSHDDQGFMILKVNRRLTHEEALSLSEDLLDSLGSLTSKGGSHKPNEHKAVAEGHPYPKTKEGAEEEDDPAAHTNSRLGPEFLGGFCPFTGLRVPLGSHKAPYLKIPVDFPEDPLDFT